MAGEVQGLKNVVSAIYPTFYNHIGVSDALKLLLEAPYNWLEQEKYYNGWGADHYVNYVCIFTIDSSIRIFKMILN